MGGSVDAGDDGRAVRGLTTDHVHEADTATGRAGDGGGVWGGADGSVDAVGDGRQSTGVDGLRRQDGGTHRAKHRP
eukprot:scaffold5502_cov115-Isochrysis_galbana.AAC.3